MKDTEFTSVEKQTIHSYMFKTLAIPATVFSAIGFLLGFLINNITKHIAYDKACIEIATSIVALTETTGKSTKNTQKSEKEVEKLLEEAKQLVEEAETIRAQLQTLQAFQKSEDIVKKVAEKIKQRNDLKPLLMPHFEKKLKALEARLSDYEVKYVRYDDALYMESSNYPDHFVRHYNYTLRIGGEKNAPYEQDRTWLIRKK